METGKEWIMLAGNGSDTTRRWGRVREGLTDVVEDG